MAKNWLIRTKSNHILGPVSKEKVVELYNNGSIKADDEICSGNGYWFFIRETDLIEKYLLGTKIQCFNPISEARDVLSSNMKKNSDQPEAKSEDITLIGTLNIADLKEPVQPNSVEVFEEFPIEQDLIKSSENVPPIDLAEKKNRKIRKDVSHHVQTTSPKHNYLKQIGLIAFLILVLVIYFRKSILKSFFKGDTSWVTPTSLIINQAYAEDQALVSKKKFLKQH
jgi:hypothetical protein